MPKTRGTTLLFLIGTPFLLSCAEGEGGGVTDLDRVRLMITPQADTLYALGDTIQLTTTVPGGNGTVPSDTAITWASLDPDVAAVDSKGRVVAKSAGIALIVASAVGVSTDTATAVVDPRVAEVRVTPSSASVAVGGTAQLNATVLDPRGSVIAGKKVMWSSSNESVAAVDGNGQVTGAGAGTATITATSQGMSGTATITVTASAAPVASVTVSPSAASIPVGGSRQLTATLEDASGNSLSGRSVTWQSSNTSVATVSASGLVRGVATGAATITATSEGKSGTAQITVTGSTTPGTVLASHDFEDGTFGGFITGTNDVSVLSDPTGSGKGKVVRVRFPRTSTSASPDVNRAFRWQPTDGFGLGEAMRFRGEFYIPKPKVGMEGAQRKLVYWQKLNRSTNPGSDFMFVKLEGFSGGGQHLKCEVRQSGAKNQVFTASAAVTFDTWHTLEVEVGMNTALGVADGTLRIWLDGVLVITSSDREWHSADSEFNYFLIGQQVQTSPIDKSILFDELRYWDNIAFSTGK